MLCALICAGQCSTTLGANKLNKAEKQGNICAVQFSATLGAKKSNKADKQNNVTSAISQILNIEEVTNFKQSIMNELPAVHKNIIDDCLKKYVANAYEARKSRTGRAAAGVRAATAKTTFAVLPSDIEGYLTENKQAFIEDCVKLNKHNKTLTMPVASSSTEKPLTRDDQLAKIRATIRATGATSGILNLVIKALYPELSESDEPFSNQQIIQILDSLLENISSPNCKSFKGKNAAEDKANCVGKIKKYIAELNPSSSNVDHTEQSAGASSSSAPADSSK